MEGRQADSVFKITERRLNTPAESIKGFEFIEGEIEIGQDGFVGRIGNFKAKDAEV